MLQKIRQKIIQVKLQLFALSAYLLASLISSVIGILVNPFLALNLSHADYALMGYFSSFTSIVLPGVGLSFASYYARNYFRFDEAKRELMKNTILTTFMVLGPVLIAVVFVIFYFYTIYTGVSFPFSPYAYLSFLPTLFGLAYSLYLTELRMRRNAKRYFYVNVAYSIVGVGLSIGLVVLIQFGAWGRLMAGLVTSILFCIYSYTHFSFHIRFDKTIFLDAMKFCWPLSLSAILYYFLSGVDRAMLEKLNDLHTYGLYNVAFQIAGYLALFATAIIQTFEPDVYKATAENNKRKLFKIVALVVVFTTIPTLLFIILAEPLIALLTYGRYTEATQLSRILALRNITMPLAFVISGIIIGYGFPKVEFVNRVIGAILSFFLFKYLILNFGFYGAAWGQVLSMLVMSMVSILFILFKTRNHMFSQMKE